jgi:predicted nuclease of predicted toxin-antitoxin system
MRFLADENVSHAVVGRLRTGGFDVTAIGETRSGAADTDVLEAATAEGRILITENRDFGELVVRQRLRVPGMILLELDRLSVAAEAEFVAQMLATHANRLLGNLIVMEPGRIRVRPLSG